MTETGTETRAAAERLAAYRVLLAARYGGLLRRGSHEAGEPAVCALEMVAEVRGHSRTDSPVALGLPDLRPLNDARWSSDATRTAHLLPVLAAYDDWREWPAARRSAVGRRIALGTVREVLPSALRAAGREEAARQCETVATLSAAAAYAAAYAAGDAAAYAAADAAAYAAADAAAHAAANAAAYAAAYAAADAAAYAAAYAAADAAADAAAYAAADAAAYAAAYAADAAAHAAVAVADAVADASTDATSTATATAAADAVLVAACRVWLEAAA